MKKTIKILIILIILIITIVIIAGIYKFDYLANQPGYNVDGNKVENLHNKN